MSGRTVRISFLASGHVNQDVYVAPTCNLSDEEIANGLNDGTIVTTIQENGEVQMTRDGTVVGLVDSVDNHLEYTDFEVTPGK